MPGTTGRNSRLRAGAANDLAGGGAGPLGDGRIVSDHELMGFEQSGDKVVAHFRQRSTGKTLDTVTGDVLIAADGIHSVVRNHFYGAKAIRCGAVACSGRRRRKGHLLPAAQW